MIVSWGDSGTKDLFNGVNSAKARRFPADLVKAMRRKLALVNAAARLDDLGAVPGNELELLKGDRKGYHSLRVNKQWRVVFKGDNGAHDVTIEDYH